MKATEPSGHRWQLCRVDGRDIDLHDLGHAEEAVRDLQGIPGREGDAVALPQQGLAAVDHTLVLRGVAYELRDHTIGRQQLDGSLEEHGAVDRDERAGLARQSVEAESENRVDEQLLGAALGFSRDPGLLEQQVVSKDPLLAIEDRLPRDENLHGSEYRQAPPAPEAESTRCSGRPLLGRNARRRLG